MSGHDSTAYGVTPATHAAVDELCSDYTTAPGLNPALAGFDRPEILRDLLELPAHVEALILQRNAAVAALERASSFLRLQHEMSKASNRDVLAREADRIDAALALARGEEGSDA